MDEFISELKREHPAVRVTLSDDDETWEDVMDDLEENPWLSFPIEDEDPQQGASTSAYDSLSNDTLIAKRELSMMQDKVQGLLILDVRGSEATDDLCFPSAIRIPIQDLTRQSISALSSDQDHSALVIVHWGDEGLSAARQAAIRLTKVFKVKAKVMMCNVLE
jgi:hypothetical protein